MSHLKKKEDQASKMLWNCLASDDGQCPKTQSRLFRITFLDSIQQEEDSFRQQTGLNLKKKLVICIVLKFGHFEKYFRNTSKV